MIRHLRASSRIVKCKLSRFVLRGRGNDAYLRDAAARMFTRRLVVIKGRSIKRDVIAGRANCRGCGVSSARETDAIVLNGAEFWKIGFGKHYG